MVDNIKFYLKDNKQFEKNLCKNPIIDLKTSYNPFTSEVTDYPMNGKFFNMSLRITEKQAFFQGSLHKFMNAFLDDQEHNHNDFDLRDIRLATEEIVNSFSINPSETEVTNLEFGFNIEIDEDPQKIIDYRLLMSKFKNHSKDLKFKGKGDYKEFIKYDYSIKVYNKSKQYGCDNYILRIEIKFFQKRILNRLGIYTLLDINNPKVVDNLFEFLMKQVEKLVIVDTYYQRTDILKRDITRLNLFTNPNYWMNAAETKHPHTRNKLIREFKTLLKKYKLDSTKKILIDKLYYKHHSLRGLADIMP